MKVILRADASEAIGVGHVTRVASLGIELINNGHSVVFITSTPGIRWVNEFLEKTGFEVVTVEPDSFDQNQIMQFNPNWIVVDSYRIPAEAISNLNKIIPVMAIIDGSTRGIDASLYLDQSPSETNYQPQLKSKLLLGPKYCLLRRELIESAFSNSSLSHSDKSVLIMLGGTDATNASTKVVEAVEMLDIECSIDLVIPRGKSLTVPNGHNKLIRIHENSSTVLMGITRPSMVISGAGTSVFEFLAMGVPLVAIALVKNQLPNLFALTEMSVIKGLDWTENQEVWKLRKLLESVWKDTFQIKDLISRGKDLIDGLGAMRVVGFMEELMK